MITIPIYISHQDFKHIPRIQKHLDIAERTNPSFNGVQFLIERYEYTCIEHEFGDNRDYCLVQLLQNIHSIIRGEFIIL